MTKINEIPFGDSWPAPPPPVDPTTDACVDTLRAIERIARFGVNPQDFGIIAQMARDAINKTTKAKP